MEDPPKVGPVVPTRPQCMCLSVQSLLHHFASLCARLLTIHKMSMSAGWCCNLLWIRQVA